MIFVCLGTQIFQFDRLLIKLDNLVEQGFLSSEDIFVQAGTINYVPRYLKFKKFLSHDEFNQMVLASNLIISHGGTGALIGALKKGKNVIAVPRLEKFGEHIDNHQLQIVKVLEEQGYLRTVYDMEKLKETIQDAICKPINKVYSRESNILSIIESFIEGS